MIRAAVLTAAFVLMARTGAVTVASSIIVPGRSIGPVVLGMTVPQVRAAMGRPFDSVGGSKRSPRYNWDEADGGEFFGWHVDFDGGRAVVISLGDILPSHTLGRKESPPSAPGALYVMAQYSGVPDEEVEKLKALKFETPEGVHFGVGMTTVINIYGNAFVSAPRPPQSPWPGIARLYYGHLHTEFVFGCPANVVRLLVEPLTAEDLRRGMGICNGYETVLTGVSVLAAGLAPGWVP